jgi:hypothetical protein
MLPQITRATGEPHSEVIMRYFISVLLLTALIVGWQRSGFAQGAGATATRTEGVAFELGWPEGEHPSGRPKAKACIKIPPDAVLYEKGTDRVIKKTEITIGPNTESGHNEDWPDAFQNHHRNDPDHPNQRRLVFAPIINLSTTPAFEIRDTTQYFTIGICARYDHRDKNDVRQHGQMARAVTPDSLEFLVRVPDGELCNLRCPHAPQPHAAGSATGYLRELFARSPFTATPLYALPNPAEGGLGGKGGSGSPFAVAENKE